MEKVLTGGIARRFVTLLALAAMVLGMVPMQAFAVVNNGVGNPDVECQANGFDFGIAKYEWTGSAWVVEEDAPFPLASYNFTNVSGSAFQFNFSVSPEVSGILAKAGTETYSFTGGTSGEISIGDGISKELSHVTFCGNNPDPVTSLTLEKIVSGGDAVPEDWMLTILGSQGNSDNGTVTKVFENFASIGNKTWELLEAPADETSSITDGYVAGTWECDGGTLENGNMLTLAEGDQVTCTITNTYTPPVLGCTDRSALNFDADATKDDGSCTYMCAYSDAGTTVDGNPAVLTYVHPNWTKEFDLTPAEWIWDAAQVTAPSPHTRTFTKTFFSPVATTGELKIAVDNLYTATLNGNPVSCDGSAGNNHAAADVCTVNVQAGINTLVVVAENLAGSGGYTGNPAGVIFTVVTEGNACVPVDQLGSITIKKEVVGDLSDWSFGFESALGDFTLTEDADSVTFNNVVAGEYLVNEIIKDGWAAPVVSCTDENSGAGQGDDQLVVALGAGEKVTCTFTNTVPVPPICPVGPGLAGVNLLKNPSFEEPAINGNYSLISPLDWLVTKVSDASATVGEIWANGFMGGASDGNQHVELDANEPTVLTQTVATVPGATYELRFDYRSRPNTSNDSNGVEALADGISIQSILGLVPEWETFADTFVAMDASTDIAFKDRGKADSLGTLLDNAVLCQTTPAPTFTISGTKYNDKDESGTVTEGDTTIEGWTFELYYNDEFVDSTETDENGEYSFVIPFDPLKNPTLFEVRERMPEVGDWEMTALFANGQLAESCRLVQPGTVVGDDSLSSARVNVISEGFEDITLDCDFLNYSEDGGETELPRCELTASDTNIRRGQEITLSWNIFGDFYSAMLTNNQNDDDFGGIGEDNRNDSRDVDGIRRDTTFTLTVFDWGEGEELVEVASCDVFVDVRSSGGGGTRVTRDRDGEVAGDSTSRPEGQVLGDQVSVVPLGAADAGAGGAAPVEIPGLGLAAAAFVARRK